MIRGVTTGRDPLDDMLVIDIGGGSTELVVAADGMVAAATSLDIGCVRLTERFLSSDPPSRPELAAASAYVRSLLPALRAGSAIGVAGTVTTLATLDLGDADYDPARTHGHRLSLVAVEEQLERLAALTTEERLAVPGLEPGRAPVIVAGVIVLREALESLRPLGDRSVRARRAPRRRVLRRRAARARGGCGATRRLHLLLGQPAAGPAARAPPRPAPRPPPSAGRARSARERRSAAVPHPRRGHARHRAPPGSGRRPRARRLGRSCDRAARRSPRASSRSDRVRPQPPRERASCE